MCRHHVESSILVLSGKPPTNGQTNQDSDEVSDKLDQNTALPVLYLPTPHSPENDDSPGEKSKS